MKVDYVAKEMLRKSKAVRLAREIKKGKDAQKRKTEDREFSRHTAQMMRRQYEWIMERLRRKSDSDHTHA